MQTAKDKGRSDSKVSKLTRELLEQNEGNVQNATLLLEKKIQEDNDLFDDFREWWLHECCRQIVGTINRNIRRETFGMGSAGTIVKQSLPQPDRNINDAGLQQLARRNANNLLCTPIWGGKMLGKASGLEVQESAARFYAQGRDMTQKGRWFAKIAQKVPKDKLVSDILSHDDLEMLWLEAERHEE